MDPTTPKIPLGKALAIICASVCVSLSLGWGGYYFFKKVREERFVDPRFHITAIAQVCMKGQILKTGYFAEYLELSVDKPQNIYRYDLKEANRKLLASPLVKQAEIKKIPPNTLYIEYETREPIAFLDDVKNTAIDSQGYLFPYKPFFTPQRLPKITIGISDVEEGLSGLEKGAAAWGQSLHGCRIDMAFKIYKLLKQYAKTSELTVIKIDASKAFALSFGQREIIVVLEDHGSRQANDTGRGHTYALRLSTERYSQELANFILLRRSLLKAPPVPQPPVSWSVIDLRLPDLAYIH